jgi:hypothetical protein
LCKEISEDGSGLRFYYARSVVREDQLEISAETLGVLERLLAMKLLSGHSGDQVTIWLCAEPRGEERPGFSLV